jgi:hypothetical protein
LTASWGITNPWAGHDGICTPGSATFLDPVFHGPLVNPGVPIHMRPPPALGKKLLPRFRGISTNCAPRA